MCLKYLSGLTEEDFSACLEAVRAAAIPAESGKAAENAASAAEKSAVRTGGNPNVIRKKKVKKNNGKN